MEREYHEPTSPSSFTSSISNSFEDFVHVLTVRDPNVVARFLQEQQQDFRWERQVHHPINSLWARPRLNVSQEDDAHHGHGAKKRKGTDSSGGSDDEDEEYEDATVSAAAREFTGHVDCNHVEHEAVEEHWIECFLELVMVGMFSNLCQTLLSGSFSFATFRIYWTLFNTISMSILSLSLTVNLLVLQDMYSLCALIMQAIGTTLMASSMQSPKDLPCQSFVTDDPEAMAWFEDGVILNCCGQLLLQVQAAWLLREARPYMTIFLCSTLFNLTTVILTPFSKYSTMTFYGVHWRANAMNNVAFCSAMMFTEMPSHMSTRHWYERLDIMVLVAMGEWILRIIVTERDEKKKQNLTRVVLLQLVTCLLLALTYFNSRALDVQLKRQNRRGKLVLIAETYMQYILAFSFFLNAVDVDINAFIDRYPEHSGIRVEENHSTQQHVGEHRRLDIDDICRPADDQAIWTKFIARWMKAINFTFCRSLLLFTRQARFIRMNPKERWFPKRFVIRFLLICCHLLVLPAAKLMGHIFHEKDPYDETNVLYPWMTHRMHALLLAIDVLVIEVNAALKAVHLAEESKSRLQKIWRRRQSKLAHTATHRLRAIRQHDVRRRLTVTSKQAAGLIVEEYLRKAAPVPELIRDPIKKLFKVPELRFKSSDGSGSLSLTFPYDKSAALTSCSTESHAVAHIHTHWLEQFNDLILVAFFSNVCHLLMQADFTMDSIMQKFQLLLYMLHGLRCVTHYYNLFIVDDLTVLINMVAVTVGTAMMASAARPAVHGLCKAEFWHIQKNAEKFEIGILVSAIAQLSLRLPAAIFESRCRVYMLILCSTNVFQIAHCLTSPLSRRGFRTGGKYWSHNISHTAAFGVCLLFTDMPKHLNMDHWYHRLDIMILVAMGEWLLQLIMANRDAYCLFALCVDMLTCLAISAQYFSSREHGVYPDISKMKGRLLLFFDIGLQCALMFCLFLNAANVAFSATLWEERHEEAYKHDHDPGHHHGCSPEHPHVSICPEALRWWKSKSLFAGRTCLLLIRHLRKIRSTSGKSKLSRIMPGWKFGIRILLVGCHLLVIPVWDLFCKVFPDTNRDVHTQNVLHLVVTLVDVLCMEIGIHKQLNKAVSQVLATADGEEVDPAENMANPPQFTPTSARNPNGVSKSDDSGLELATIESLSPASQRRETPEDGSLSKNRQDVERSDTFEIETLGNDISETPRDNLLAPESSGCEPSTSMSLGDEGSASTDPIEKRDSHFTL